MFTFLFPFECVPPNSRIILYAAGNCGRQFFYQIKKSNYCEVVLWVDKSVGKVNNNKMAVQPVSCIKNVTFDYLVIAIQDFETRLYIKNMLISDYEVSSEIIVDTVHKIEQHGSLYNSQYEEFAAEGSNNLKKLNAAELVVSNRLDTMVRYMLCKDIINGIENESHLSLYSRMILSRGSRHEGSHYFQEHTRFTANDFIEDLKNLCESMKENGFQKECYIPVSAENNITLNGQHRLAASLALEEDIWVKYYPFQQGNEDMGINWFIENGFSTYDILDILRAFSELYSNCSIALLYGTVIEQWDYLQKQISKDINIVGYTDLDFSDNFIAFESLIHEIYDDPLWKNVFMDRKLDFLKLAPLKIRVLLLSDENEKGCSLYEKFNLLKLDLRKDMYFETDIAPVVMHAADSYDEFIHLRNILLSANNIRSMKKRIYRNYTEAFIKRIDQLKDLLVSNGINSEDAIVLGSSPMEIYGIRKSADIDFAIKSKYYTNLDCRSQLKEKNIECIQNATIFTDDLLIEDHNLHFVFHGIKFVNLEIVKLKKQHDKRDKDLKDVRYIEVFEDFCLNFDNKQILKQQINKQMHQQRF